MQLRRFNKEVKLKQLHFKRQKNKYFKKTSIVVLTLVMFVGTLYFTFATFYSSNDFEIVNANVGDFVTDVVIKYYYDDSEYDVPPSNMNDYNLDNNNSSCSNASYDYDYSDNTLELSNIIGKVTCELHFEKSFYGKVSLGDTVYMVPTQTSYSISKEETGLSDYNSSASNQIINPRESTYWIVLNKKEDGTIELISKYALTDNNKNGIVFYNYGYQSYIKVLNEISTQYYNDSYTIENHTTPYFRHFGYNGQTEYFTGNLYLTDASVSTPALATGDLEGEEYQNGFRGDTKYIKDYNLLINAMRNKNPNLSEIKALITYDVDEEDYMSYYVASRYFEYTNLSNYKWSVRSVYVDTKYSMYYFNAAPIRFYSNNKWNSSIVQYGLRPIITIKPHLSGYKNPGGTYQFD